MLFRNHHLISVGQDSIEHVVEFQNGGKHEKVFDTVLVGGQRDQNKDIDDLDKNTSQDLEQTETDWQSAIELEVVLVHRDVLQCNRCKVDVVHRKVVEDARTDEPGDLDGPRLRHFVYFVDVLIPVLGKQQ